MSVDAVSEQLRRPRLFVGSAVESLDIAYAVQENLEFAAEVTVWTQGVFTLTRSTLSSLLEVLGSFDFAVFVMTPDDVVKMRDVTVRTARDNIIFELGLFLGELGEDRTFVVLPRGVDDLHLPSDLVGTTAATYEPQRSDENLVAALGPACNRIRRSIQAAGGRPSSVGDQASIAAPVAAGLSDELRREISQLLRDQELNLERTLARFEERVAAAGSAEARRAKAPYARIRNTIDQLSPLARALVLEIAHYHINSEKYDALRGTPLRDAIDELRHVGLLVPVQTPADQTVYWFPPGTSPAVQAALDTLQRGDAEAVRAVKQYLAAVKYPEP